MNTSLSNGFVKQCVYKGAETGHLRGLTFAVKDMYEVCGHSNACGNPTWLATHSDTASTHAPCVQSLLDAGATLLGMAHMDELAYSLNGQNYHFGTPINKAAPGSVPGGSSSGSASIVAWEEADFAVGSDTAGSVRIPASYQGIFGFRPTHGRVSMAQSVPLARSFDTCGWFARDASTLRKVGSILLASGSARPSTLQENRSDDVHAQPRVDESNLRQWLVAKDAFASCEDTSKAIYERLSKDLPAVKAVLGEPKEIDITNGMWTLQQWLSVFRTIQSAEVWEGHGRWIEAHNPEFGPGIRERFDGASQVTAEAVEQAKSEQERIVQHVNSVLTQECFLTIPTAPGPAPALDCTGEELESFRARALALTSIAGLCGLPEVTLPVASMENGPVGLSIVGPRGSDEELLVLAERLADTLNLP